MCFASQEVALGLSSTSEVAGSEPRASFWNSFFCSGVTWDIAAVGETSSTLSSDSRATIQHERTVI